MKSKLLSLMVRCVCLLLIFSTITCLPGCTTGTEGEKEMYEPNYRLWYDEPAPETNEGFESLSLPLGNGYMGVSVFGGTEYELLSIAEKSLFNPLLAYSKISEYGPDGDKRMMYGQDGFNTLSKTYIDFNHDFDKVKNYQRDLVLENAEAHVQYEYDGVIYKREFFSSYPDKVTVIRISASKNGALDFTLRPTAPFVRDYASYPGDGKSKSGTVEADADTITLSGTLGYYSLNYEAQFKVIPDGGTLNTQYDKISVEGANSAVIIIAVGTNYEFSTSVFTNPNATKLDANSFPHDKVSKYIEDASSKSYDELKNNHRADFQNYFLRADLDLGASAPKDVTTDQLLIDYKNTENCLYLEELVFQYGRYLLIASTRKGCLPPNLQGTWNFYEASAWGGGYVHNINLQMNYWPAFNTNLLDLFDTYIDFHNSYIELAKKNADKYLFSINSPSMTTIGTGENGWALGSKSTPYSSEAPTIDHSGPGTTGFTSLIFWDYYDYTRDKALLKDVVYPAIEGSATFLSKTLDLVDGKWLVYNSASPENGSTSQEYYRTIGTAFDQQMVYENYLIVQQAAQILGYTEQDHKILGTISDQIDLLDPVLIGKSGQIKEFREEDYYGEIGEYEHRHISQLVGLYPGTLINSNTDAWLDAAKVSLSNRGQGSTGWAIGHRINAAARLKDGEMSYDLLKHMIKSKLMSNLWDTHPPFQIDGNFGVTAGIGEMLLQSHEGYIDILPAIPEKWVNGSYKGLTARGNFEVDAEWKDGTCTKIVIKSNAGTDCTVKYNMISNATVLDANGNTVAFTVNNNDLISFKTDNGGVYTITNIPASTTPDSPDGLVLEDRGGYSIKWQAVDNAQSYNVYCAVNNQPQYKLVASELKEPCYAFHPEEFEESDQVIIRVTAVNSAGIESSGTTILKLNK